MSHPMYHALSSAKKHGGKMEDYIDLHKWFDESKELFPDMRHRALRHHAEGIFLAEKIFGLYVVNCDGKKVPTRTLGEQHVMEDLGWIPTLQDWLKCMRLELWMMRPGKGAMAEREIRKNREDYVR